MGTILLLTNDPTFIVSEEAFVAPSGATAGATNLLIQHWRHKEPPILNAATASGSTITLVWTNEHAGRGVDSTFIYRDGGSTPVATVGPADTTWADSNLAPATYSYTLKHGSFPGGKFGSLTPAYPNSPSSNALQATVEPPPPPLALEISGPDLITEDDYYTWTMLVTGGTTPYRPRR
ncbi:MAG TPA: hypothetical protein VGA02_07970 [Gemmatimonadales bacterium]